MRVSWRKCLVGLALVALASMVPWHLRETTDRKLSHLETGSLNVTMLAKHEAKEFTLGLHRQPRTLFTKRYQVRDDFLKIGGAGETTSGAPTAKQIIESRGIEFPSGGRAEFDKDRSSLVVTTTSEQFELIDAFVESIAEEVVKQVEVTVRFIEITDDNIEELLGFDWLNSFPLEQDTEDL